MPRGARRWVKRSVDVGAHAHASKGSKSLRIQIDEKEQRLFFNRLANNGSLANGQRLMLAPYTSRNASDIANYIQHHRAQGKKQMAAERTPNALAEATVSESIQSRHTCLASSLAAADR